MLCMHVRNEFYIVQSSILLVLHFVLQPLPIKFHPHLTVFSKRKVVFRNLNYVACCDYIFKSYNNFIYMFIHICTWKTYISGHNAIHSTYILVQTLLSHILDMQIHSIIILWYFDVSHIKVKEYRKFIQ